MHLQNFFWWIPQMSPMNWIFISMYFSLIWILLKLMFNYFFFLKKEGKMEVKLNILKW